MQALSVPTGIKASALLAEIKMGKNKRCNFWNLSALCTGTGVNVQSRQVMETSQSGAQVETRLETNTQTNRDILPSIH